MVGQHQNPRSYLVDTGTQILRRNRVAIRRAAPTGLEKSPEPQRCQDETEKVVWFGLVWFGLLGFNASATARESSGASLAYCLCCCDTISETFRDIEDYSDEKA